MPQVSQAIPTPRGHIACRKQPEIADLRPATCRMFKTPRNTHGVIPKPYVFAAQSFAPALNLAIIERGVEKRFGGRLQRRLRLSAPARRLDML